MAPCRGNKDQVLESAHPPAGKLTSTAVSAGVLAATLGAMAASVAAGGGRLEHVWRRACRAVKMLLKGMASASLCGAQRGSTACASWAGIEAVLPHRSVTLDRPCWRGEVTSRSRGSDSGRIRYIALGFESEARMCLGSLGKDTRLGSGPDPRIRPGFAPDPPLRIQIRGG